MNNRSEDQPRMCWWQGPGHSGGGRAGWRYPCGLCNTVAVTEPGGLCEACSPTITPTKRAARKPAKRSTTKTRSEATKRTTTKTAGAGTGTAGRGRRSA